MSESDSSDEKPGWTGTRFGQSMGNRVVILTRAGAYIPYVDVVRVVKLF